MKKHQEANKENINKKPTTTESNSAPGFQDDRDLTVVLRLHVVIFKKAAQVVTVLVILLLDHSFAPPYTDLVILLHKASPEKWADWLPFSRSPFCLRQNPINISCSEPLMLFRIHSLILGNMNSCSQSVRLGVTLFLLQCLHYLEGLYHSYITMTTTKNK